MLKLIKFSFVAFVFALSFCSFAFAADETITVTTYYPSPYGSYQNLTTTRLAVNTTTISSTYPFYVSGTTYCTSGAWTASDRRWKKDIVLLEDSLNKTISLQGVNYYWRIKEYPDKGFTDGKQIGMIAQDVEKVVPEVVTTDEKGYKGISYEKLVPVLVEAIKSLKNKVDGLNQELADLKDNSRALEKRVKELEDKQAPLGDGKRL